MSLYVRLDESLWQAIQFVSAVTAVGFTFVGGVVGGQAALGGLTHDQTIAIGLLPVGVLVLLGSLSLRRIRGDTQRLVALMGKMEDPGHFFSYRLTRMEGDQRTADGLPTPSRWARIRATVKSELEKPSATKWYARVFTATGAVLVAYALVQLVHR